MKGGLAGFVWLLLVAWVPGAAAQLPDNRGVELDPEDEVNPAYQESLDVRDRADLERALEQGESHLPTLSGTGEAPAEASSAPAPVDEREPEAAAVDEGYEHEELVPVRPGSAGARDYSAQFEALIEALTAPRRIVRITYPAPDAPEEAAPAPARADTPGPSALPAVRAGEGFYARTLYAVNSDYPGPVVIELLEPPLAGAVVTGRFSRVGERMVLRLLQLDWRGERVAVEGWGVGLDCACFGVAGEVDRHWFARVLLPAAVRFASGFLAAVSRADETLVFDGDVRYERRRGDDRDAVLEGLGTAAGRVGEVLLETAPSGPTVRLPRNTELVVMFTRPLEAGGAGAVTGAAAEPDDG